MQQKEKTMHNKNLKLNEYQLHTVSNFDGETLRHINSFMPSDWLDDTPKLTKFNRATRLIIKVKMDDSLPFTLDDIFKTEQG